MLCRTGLPGRVGLNEISAFTGVVTVHAYTHARQHQPLAETLMRMRQSLSQCTFHRQADALSVPCGALW